MSQTPGEKIQSIQIGIEELRQEEFLRALTTFERAYSGLGDAALTDGRAAQGLSHYGLCLALVQKKYKQAIDLCRKALELQFYNPDHYVNLSRVYIAAGNRRKAVETLEEGMRVLPDDESLLQLRTDLGSRSRPAVPFLGRGNPINVALGRTRHASKRPEKKPDGDQDL